MARIRDTKILKKIRYIKKLCINILLNTRGGSVTLEAGET